MTTEGRHRHGPGYWLRVAVVGGVASLLLTATLVSLGETTRLPVVLRHTLVHSTIMAGLCGALMPGIRHRLGGARAVVGWAVTIPALLTLAAGRGLDEHESPAHAEEIAALKDLLAARDHEIEVLKARLSQKKAK